ncbi:MAG TPA: HAD family hydrolase [Polyangia bacterium]|nr:HAD family hydrolase [Polyangia bacterium]
MSAVKTPVTTILFDAGGTLVFPSFARIAEQLALEGVTVDASALARGDARIRFELDRHDVVAATNDGDRFRRYLDALVRGAGLAGLPEAAFIRLRDFHQTHNLWDHLPDDVTPALERLRGKFRLGLVSNSNGTVRAKLERLDLARFFETIVDSQIEGIEKPDPRLFAIALTRMGVTAAETAYVGDLFHVDVVGARGAGLWPVLLDPLDLYSALDVTRVRTLGDLEAALAARGAVI